MQLVGHLAMAVLAIVYCLSPRLAAADEWHRGMELACDPNGRFAVLRVAQYLNDDAPEYPGLAGEVIDDFEAFQKKTVTTEETCGLGGGIEVKIKRGKHPWSPGYCEIDRGEFLTVWFDRRKIISKYKFAGCWGSLKQVDAWLNSIIISHEKVVLCRNKFEEDSLGMLLVPTGDVSCEDMSITELSREIDSIEYSSNNETRAKVGSLITTFGSDVNVCQAFERSNMDGGRISIPVGFLPALPEQMNFELGTPYYFKGLIDMNHDGRVEEVYARDYHGSNFFLHSFYVLPPLQAGEEPRVSANFECPFNDPRNNENCRYHPPDETTLGYLDASSFPSKSRNVHIELLQREDQIFGLVMYGDNSGGEIVDFAPDYSPNLVCRFERIQENF